MSNEGDNVVGVDKTSSSSFFFNLVSRPPAAPVLFWQDYSSIGDRGSAALEVIFDHADRPKLPSPEEGLMGLT